MCVVGTSNQSLPESWPLMIYNDIPLAKSLSAQGLGHAECLRLVGDEGELLDSQRSQQDKVLI